MDCGNSLKLSSLLAFFIDYTIYETKYWTYYLIIKINVSRSPIHNLFQSSLIWVYPPQVMWVWFPWYDRASSFFPLRTPCKINPAVNTVLSVRKPRKEETPLKRLQEHHQQQKDAESGKLQEQSMYCKELLLSGAAEFCFEELRAERFFKKVTQDVSAPKDPASSSASNWCT